MGNQLPEDMVYTITTGFYPEMFSKTTKWKGGFGKGRKGMQWRAKRGWSGGSLKEVGGRKIDKQDFDSFLSAMRPGVKKDGTEKKVLSWSDAASKYLTSEESTAANQRRDELSTRDMEENLTYYKFMGNNENYKLWGTKVWWQEGQRQKKGRMEEDINEWSYKDFSDSTQKLSTYLEEMYTGKEKSLIKLAQKLAKEVFGKAIHKDNLRKDLKTVGAEAHVPEEEREEAGEGGGEEVSSISDNLAKISRARGLDVKYRMQDGTALYIDSTEVPITVEHSHGIVEQTEVDMQKAIDNAKKGAKGWKQELKDAVTKMFIKNISIYNPLISKMMGGPKEKEGAAKVEFMKMMGKITQQNKKNTAGNKIPPDPKATVKQIAEYAAIEGMDKAQNQTAMSYVVHTVMSLMGDANANYRQGHKVGRIHGRNTYASVAMRLEESSGVPQFDPAFMEANTSIIQGETHLIAIQEKDRRLRSGIAYETQVRQMQAFMQGKIIGATVGGQTGNQANAQLNLRQEVRQSTTVTFSPKALKNMFNQIPEIIKDNTEDTSRMTETAKNFMANKKTNKLASHGSVKFWAMPYLGLMEYPTKSEQ